jgi:hypothetical protein
MFRQESNTLQIIRNIFYFQMDLADSRNPIRYIFPWIGILPEFLCLVRIRTRKNLYSNMSHA